ncbi:MAG: group II intron maturase-specific domain-containing protein, partial [Geminicoccaceae bacterium]
QNSAMVDKDMRKNDPAGDDRILNHPANGSCIPLYKSPYPELGLGSLSNDGSERRIAPKALARFKKRVRDLTRRTKGVSLSQLIEKLASYLIGWRGYFGFCQTPRVLSNLDASIRRRLRSYLWWQWRNGRKRFKELRRLGVPKFPAAIAAGSPTSFWRMSSHPAVQMALRNHYFDEAGLPRLHNKALA